MAGLPTNRVLVRAGCLRLETLDTFAVGLLRPVRLPGVPVDGAPVWPA